MTISKTTAEAIATALIHHRYASEVAALRDANKTLAMVCYNLKWTSKQLAMMADAPKGWLDETNHLQARTERGYAVNLYFAGNTNFFHMPACKPASVLWPKANVYGNAYVNVKGEVSEALVAHAQACSALNERINADHKKAVSIIKAQSTVAKLIEMWPEVGPFAAEHAPIAKSQLPAIRTEELNALFRLPA